MKVSHIIIKVNCLDEAVKEWTKNGFIVEYGKKKNSYNALIYFKEGPYIELYERCGMPSLLKKVMKFFGKKAFVDRMDFWDNHQEGIIGLELETYQTNVEKEVGLLREYNEKYMLMNCKRLDAKDRKLEFTCVFPDSMKIPAFMTYFSIDPKPKTDIHLNGIKGVKSIAFGTEEELIPLINKLCDDDRLKLFIGSGVCDLEWL